MVRNIIALCVLLIASSVTIADNHVYIDVVKQGQDKNADTLFVGMHYEARIFIRNDFTVREMRIAPRFRGGIVGKDGDKAGHFWDWLDAGGYGTSACVTVVPGCRMDDPAVVWDSLFTILELNMNEDSPDSLGIRGVAKTAGMPTGESEHMISIHFTPRMPTYGMVTLWIDTAHVSPTGGLTFYDWAWTPTVPGYSSPGQWPIAIVCGDANGDGKITVGDGIFIINYIFRGGPAPVPVQAANANCDANLNSGDAVYIVNFIFRGGPPPCCP
jgi:hypothetical protein